MKEIDLRDLLDTEFTINDKLEMVGTFTLDKINMIADILIKLNEENEKLNNIIHKTIEYITDNCVLSDEWKDLGFCNFIPTGRIEYKQLSKTKIKHLLNILRGGKDE